MFIFLDANILVDVLDKSSYESRLCTEALRILRLSKKPILVSPTTFAIVSYIFVKRNKTKANVNQMLKHFFKPFYFTTENQDIMNNVLSSTFEDLEDALQFYSATDAKAKMIITKNKKDFPKTKNIVIMHPKEFVELYYQ
jgi:predicted nucleic acid-binding protein